MKDITEQEFKDIEQMLRPQCEFHASDSLKERILGSITSNAKERLPQSAQTEKEPRRHKLSPWMWMVAACIIGLGLFTLVSNLQREDTQINKEKLTAQTDSLIPHQSQHTNQSLTSNQNQPTSHSLATNQSQPTIQSHPTIQSLTPTPKRKGNRMKNQETPAQQSQSLKNLSDEELKQFIIQEFERQQREAKEQFLASYQAQYGDDVMEAIARQAMEIRMRGEQLEERIAKLNSPSQ